MGKQKRLRKERAQQENLEAAFETAPKHPKWYYTVYRLMMVVIGCLALTCIAASLATKYLPPEYDSVWPGLLTMLSWFLWILYVFKGMKIKD